MVKFYNVDIGICWTLEFDDVCGQKIKLAVIQMLEGMWCPDCMKFYNIGETTCEKCGQELLKCYNIRYETRPKPKTEPLFRSKPRNKKRKLKG